MKKKDVATFVEEMKSIGDEWTLEHPECPRGGSTMDFHGHYDYGDFDYGEGYRKCNSYGFKVAEDDL